MRIGLLGAGAIGQRHMRVISDLIQGDVEFYWVTSGKGNNLVLGDDLTVLEERDIASYYPIVQVPAIECLESCSLDIAIVSNPNILHYPSIIKLVESKIPVFCEKPAVLNATELGKCIEKLDESNIFNHVGYNYIFTEAYEKFKEIFFESIDEIVALEVFCSDFLPYWHPYEDFRKSYAASFELGGGALITQSHELHLLSTLAPIFELQSAFVGSISKLNLPVEDHVDILFFVVCGGRRIPVNSRIMYHSIEKSRHIRIRTNSDCFELDLISSEVKSTTEGLIYRGSGDRNSSFKKQWSYVFDCLKHGKKSKSDFRSVQSLHEFIDTVYSGAVSK